MSIIFAETWPKAVAGSAQVWYDSVLARPHLAPLPMAFPRHVQCLVAAYLMPAVACQRSDWLGDEDYHADISHCHRRRAGRLGSSLAARTGAILCGCLRCALASPRLPTSQTI